MLIKYIRNKDRQPRAVVVATGPNQVGWSMCNVKAGDRFSKQRGKDIAIGRSKSNRWQNDPPTFPAKINGEDVVWQEVNHMVARSRKYFKEECMN